MNYNIRFCFKSSRYQTGRNVSMESLHNQSSRWLHSQPSAQPGRLCAVSFQAGSAFFLRLEESAVMKASVWLNAGAVFPLCHWSLLVSIFMIFFALQSGSETPCPGCLCVSGSPHRISWFCLYVTWPEQASPWGCFMGGANINVTLCSLISWAVCHVAPDVVLSSRVGGCWYICAHLSPLCLQSSAWMRATTKMMVAAASTQIALRRKKLPSLPLDPWPQNRYNKTLAVK